MIQCQADELLAALPPVTDEMVERALHAFTHHPIPRGNYGESSERDMMRAALTAALTPPARFSGGACAGVLGDP